MGRQVLRRYGEPWEEMEREHVHKYYKLLGARSCANYLGRPISGVRAMARKLGVATRREWTKKEIRFVQDNYERIGGKCGTRVAQRISIGLPSWGVQPGWTCTLKGQFTVVKTRTFTLRTGSCK